MREFIVMMSGWAAHYLVHSAVVLIALGAAAWWGDRLLRRVGPAGQHRMWVAALLAGVALPLLPAGWLSGMGHSAASSGGGTVTITYHVIAAAVERWTIPSWVGAAVGTGYLLTLLFCVVRLAQRWRRTNAMVRRATAFVLDSRAERLLEDAAMRADVVVSRVRCSTETHGPVVLGWRPLLIVPEGFFEAGEEDIAAALAHEYVHIARRDFAKNLLYEFAAVAVAYHPVCRMIRRRIAETREMICDELAASEDRTEYAASLLRLAQTMASPAVGASHAIGVFDGDILEERIMRLTMDVLKVSRIQKVAMATAAACALLGGAWTAMALPLDATQQTTAQGKVYKVGGDVKPPVLVHSVDAEYSKKAKDAKFQGVSVVSLIVGADGLPHHVHTTRKLGMGLDEKAIEAVRQYRFQPSTLHGKRVAVAITIEVNFRMY
jgi:beta-lactamase regulating signal transducer with metallopeptidase domain